MSIEERRDHEQTKNNDSKHKKESININVLLHKCGFYTSRPTTMGSCVGLVNFLLALPVSVLWY